MPIWVSGVSPAAGLKSEPQSNEYRKDFKLIRFAF